jgi:hypothetical protein
VLNADSFRSPILQEIKSSRHTNHNIRTLASWSRFATTHAILLLFKKDVRGIWIEDGGGGCKNVAVGFVSEGLTAGGTVDDIEYQMEEIYQAAYGDPQLANTVCYVTANAYAKLTDNLGNVTTEKVYSTTMNQATGKSVNWRNSYAVDFPNVWTVNYESPVYTRQKAINVAKKAADCAHDDGLFDVDIDCP